MMSLNFLITWFPPDWYTWHCFLPIFLCNCPKPGLFDYTLYSPQAPVQKKTIFKLMLLLQTYFHFSASDLPSSCLPPAPAIPLLVLCIAQQFQICCATFSDSMKMLRNISNLVSKCCATNPAKHLFWRVSAHFCPVICFWTSFMGPPNF